MPSPAMTENCRFVLLGTGGNFTFHVMQTLAEQGVLPQVYFQWQRNQPRHELSGFGIPIDIPGGTENLTGLLKQHAIKEQYGNEKLASRITALKVDFLLVACWPVLIARDVIDAVGCAALNLHPSLLPKYRGMDPIAEQLKVQEKNKGVTLHLLSQQYDRGDIVLQQQIEKTLHEERKEIETACARAGAGLFIKAVKTCQNPGWKLIKQI